jgi:hypothetical protein
MYFIQFKRLSLNICKGERERGSVHKPRGRLFRLLDFGQETVVLSGLNKQAGESLKHIRNLYDETKHLKSYLEQVCEQTNITCRLQLKNISIILEGTCHAVVIG